MTTEKSADDAVLNDVFSSGRDRGADTAAPVETPETVEAQPTPTGEPPKPAADPNAAVKPETEPDGSEPKGYRDPSTGRFVPLKELTTEREKRQAAEKTRDDEARLRKDAEDNWRRTQAQVEEIQRRLTAPPQPQQQPPDPNLDPAGAFAYQQNEFQQALLNQRLNTSEMFARTKHGDQIVDAAFQAANQAGALQHFARSRDCYGDMIKWHRHQQVLQRVGDDPDAYEKTLEEKIRAKVLEELKTGNRTAMPGAPAPAPQKFPGSLADATATGPTGAQPTSDEAALGSVFASGRKRR